MVIPDQNFAKIANMQSVFESLLCFWYYSQSNIAKKPNSQKLAPSDIEIIFYLAIIDLAFKWQIFKIHRFKVAHSNHNVRIKKTAKFQRLKRSGFWDISDFVNPICYSMTLNFETWMLDFCMFVHKFFMTEKIPPTHQFVF